MRNRDRGTNLVPTVMGNDICHYCRRGNQPTIQWEKRGPMTHETTTPQQATPNPAPLWRRIWKWVLGGGLIVLVVGLVAFVASLTGILSYLGITPPTRAPQVEITHIEHPAGRAIEGEYVRIENKGKAEIEMGGWTLSDEEDKHTFLFPPFTLKAGA